MNNTIAAIILSIVMMGQAIAGDVYRTVCTTSEPTQQEQEAATLVGGILGWLLSDGDGRAAVAGALIGATTAGEEVCVQELRPHVHHYKWVRVETHVEWL